MQPCKLLCGHPVSIGTNVRGRHLVTDLWGALPITDDDREARKQQLDLVRQRREMLLRAIEENQWAIDRSRELVKWMDDLLASEENSEP
jgi:hypothetical protein